MNDLKPQIQNSPFNNIQKAFTNLQSHFSNFQNQAKQVLESGFPRNIIKLPSPPPSKNQNWARIFGENFPGLPSLSSSSTPSSLSIQDIEERLAGVPVYGLSNPSDEFVLVSSVNSGKALGLFCFNEQDVQTLLKQMQSMDPTMRNGSKVVAVALNKERKRAGLSDGSFSGVPVFQSRSLVLKSPKTRYRPVFFRKEDLEKSLQKASHDQRKMNPALREGDIQVAVLEDIIQGMKDKSKSEWDDVVFIPPGFDVTVDSSQSRISQ